MVQGVPGQGLPEGAWGTPGEAEAPGTISSSEEHRGPSPPGQAAGRGVSARLRMPLTSSPRKTRPGPQLLPSRFPDTASPPRFLSRLPLGCLTTPGHPFAFLWRPLALRGAEWLALGEGGVQEAKCSR